MEYALPYILFICVLGIAAFAHQYAKDDRIKFLIQILCAALFLFFFGFRGFCFYDWQNYAPVFFHCTLEQTLQEPLMKWVYEPGFMLLMMFTKSIVNNFHVFVFLCTCINTLLIFRFLRHRVENIPLGLMIFVCMGGLGLFIDLMRNSIAILIFINALEFLEKRRPVPYFLCCTIAMTFHLSAVVYFPMYFFLHRRLNKWVYLGIFVLGNAILLLHISVFMNLISLVLEHLSPKLLYKIKVYTTLEGHANFKISIGYLERLFSGIMVFLYIDKLRAVRKDNDMFINGLMLYFLVYFGFSEFPTIAMRMSKLFEFGYWILWIDLIKCFHHKNNRRLYIAFLIIYCLLKIHGKSNNIIARYDNILFEHQTFEERFLIFKKSFNEV